MLTKGWERIWFTHITSTGVQLISEGKIRGGWEMSDGKALNDGSGYLDEVDYLHNLQNGEPKPEVEAVPTPRVTYLFGLSPEEAVRVINVMTDAAQAVKEWVGLKQNEGVLQKND